MLKIRFQKIFYTLQSIFLLKRLFQFHIFASLEHSLVLKNLKFNTIVDIGANRGQFSLACRYFQPSTVLYSFEPLNRAADIFKKVFSGDVDTTLYRTAICPQAGVLTMHISRRDDSSSVLPIGDNQSLFFPGTEEETTAEVHGAPLSTFLSSSKIVEPSLLKIDVQGFEYEVLLGSEDLLGSFSYIYCELSFIELYRGQKLIDYVCEWLFCRSFQMVGIYNISYDDYGQSIQADCLFKKKL